MSAAARLRELRLWVRKMLSLAFVEEVVVGRVRVGGFLRGLVAAELARRKEREAEKARLEGAVVEGGGDFILKEMAWLWDEWVM